MRKVSCITLLAGALAIASASPVFAAPIHITFDGVVAGMTNSNLQLLSDYGIGTNVSFDLTFDETALPAPVSVSYLDLSSLPGRVSIGADQWSLESGSVGAGYGNNPPIFNYYLDFAGTGPVTGHGGVFFGLFFMLKPDLSLFDDTLKVGFAYTTEYAPGFSTTHYSYAALDGDFNLERMTSVPEPGTAVLFLPALAMIWGARRVRDLRRIAVT